MIGGALKKFEELHKRFYPTTASIELTTRCNQACDYCFIEPSSTELTTSQLCDVLDRFTDAGIVSLLLTGGEPFIRTDILQILDHAVKKRFFDVVILTNGTLITAEHISFLARHSKYFGYIRFSFFSHNARLHDSFTKTNGSFDRALAAADALHAAGVRVFVIVNLTESNLDSLNETKSFFSERDFEVHIGSLKINSNDYIRRAYAPTTTKSFLKRYLSLSSGDGAGFMRECFEENIKTFPFEGYLCKSLLGHVAIRADGSIVPCLSFRSHSISNITEDRRPIHEIVRESSLYAELRSLRRTDLDKCGSCRFVRFCVLCPGIMYSENKTWKKPMRQTCNYAEAYYETIYKNR